MRQSVNHHKGRLFFGALTLMLTIGFAPGLFAQNLAPVITVPTDEQATLINQALTFNAGVNEISVADDSVVPMQVSLTATSGVVTIDTTNLIFTTGDGTEDAVIVFSGDLADVNAALDGLSFKPTNGFLGFASLKIDVDDQDPGGALTDSETINIEVALTLNAAPVITAPTNIPVVYRNKSRTFTIADGSAMSVSDADSGNLAISGTLQATNGVMSMTTVNGIFFNTGNGDGVDDPLMEFVGTQEKIRGALDGLIFTPTADYSGAASIVFTVNDLGNSGGGGEKSTSYVLNLTVEIQSNVAPVVNIPPTQESTSFNPIVFSTALGNAITVEDEDSEGNNEILTLDATGGEVSLGSDEGLTYITGDGTRDEFIQVEGTVNQLNEAMEGLTFYPTIGDITNNRALDVTLNDQGNSGEDGPRSTTETITFNIAFTVNQAPLIFLPDANPQITRARYVLFSVAGGNGIQVADADVGNERMQVTIETLRSAGNVQTNAIGVGTVSLATVAGLDFDEGNGRTDKRMVFEGTLIDINRGLNGMRYFINETYSGQDSLKITVNDLGHSGDDAGGKSDSGSVFIDIASPIIDDGKYANRGSCSMGQSGISGIAMLLLLVGYVVMRRREESVE